MGHWYPSITENINVACSLCHASFPLIHTEHNGNLARCLEQQHFAFMLWYLPQLFPLAFFPFIRRSRKATNILFESRLLSLKLTRKRPTFVHWPAREQWATPEGPCFEFFKHTAHWWLLFGSEKPSCSSSLHTVGGVSQHSCLGTI